MALLAGTRLGPYEVISPLGSGGMGEVYRARDTRLGREVAVKVLPEEFSRDPERLRRFEQEARSASALSDPHIVTVFDVGEAGGIHYFASELVEGSDLRQLLQEGALSLKKALDLAEQIASGLAAAHEKGIVHRDLKPENVLITKSGLAKIADFGLAKLTESAAAKVSELPTSDGYRTSAGVILGTVAYMSPEQVRGEVLDHRSDVFSFGAVLYELLTGRKAFGRSTAAETMAAILKEEPPELPERSIPPGLAHALAHCLEKNPEQRFQSARDIVFALGEAELPSTASTPQSPREKASSPKLHIARRVGLAAAAAVALAILAVLFARQIRPGRPAPPGSSPGQPARIVVLPFENLGSPDDAYFASGMTEEITSRLANVRSLAVISRTTATQYETKGKTVEQIGKDLGVGYVLEGSVRWDKSGGGSGRVRITPQLIRVSDDTHLWTERYDRQLADIFAIQTDVADGVVRALNLTLAPAEATSVRQIPTRDIEAYDLYLRALDQAKLLGSGALREQIRLAGEAVEHDPGFAEALALLARARTQSYFLRYDRRESELERARAEAERAVSLRPGAAETHLALGYYFYQGRLDYERALAELEKARALRPNDASVHAAIGLVLRMQGKLEEGEAELRKALAADPKNGVVCYSLGQTQLFLHKYSDALRSFELSTSLDPRNRSNYTLSAQAHLMWHGDVAAAERVLERAAAIPGLEDPNGSLNYEFLRVAFFRRDWERALQRLNGAGREAISIQAEYVPLPLLRAELHSYTGRRDRARESYEEARRILAARISETPDDSRLRSSFGIALAGLGQTADAVREGERAIELMPPARNAVWGARRVEDLALIHTMVGNQEASIQQLEYLLSHPSYISVPLLKLDPRWDPLRKNPKFEALLAKYEVKP